MKTRTRTNAIIAIAIGLVALAVVAWFVWNTLMPSFTGAASDDSRPPQSSQGAQTEDEAAETPGGVRVAETADASSPAEDSSSQSDAARSSQSARTPTRAGSTASSTRSMSGTSNAANNSDAPGESGNRDNPTNPQQPDVPSPIEPVTPDRPVTYQVSYDLQGGSVDAASDGTTEGSNALPDSYTTGNTLALPANLVRKGYSFEGWTSSAEPASTPPNKNVVITSANSNLSFQAHWKPLQYRITYNLDGGSMGAASLPSSYTVESAELNIELPTTTSTAPTKNNYKFYRWENADGEKVTTLHIPRGSTGDVVVTAKWMTPLAIEYVKIRTPQEIADYIARSGFKADMGDGNTASDIANGNIGEVPQEVQDNAIANLNIIRYIAGVEPVRFDRGLYERAQAAAALIAHTHNVTHYPNREASPEVPQDIFQKAYDGSANSNLVAGSGIANVVSGSFVPDPGNIANGKSHRRYCLNPALKTVAFGAATENGHGGRAMYVMGEGQPWNQHFTVWPSSNVPIEYYPKVNADRTWWTVCIHRGGQIEAQAANIKVTLKYDGKTQVLTIANGGALFNEGTIMFRPDRDVKAGDEFDVKVEGVTDKQQRPVPIEYTVHFFNLSDYQANVQSYSMATDSQNGSLASIMSAATAHVVEKVRAMYGNAGLLRTEDAGSLRAAVTDALKPANADALPERLTIVLPRHRG